MKRLVLALGVGGWLQIICAAGAHAESSALAQPAPRSIDAFESADAWTPLPADGVEMRLSQGPGLHGRSLRVDFRFVKGGGYAVLRRVVNLDLPENYAFRFHLRAEAPEENLELKLVDSTGANVWWCNRRDFHFSPAWQLVTTRKRQLPFAWGPAGGGEIRHVAAIEFAITAGSGGKGTVWLDDLELVTLPPADRPPPAVLATSSSSRPGHEGPRAADGDGETFWTSRAGDARPWVEFDLGVLREFGGLRLDAPPLRRPQGLAVDLEDGDGAWRRAGTIAAGGRKRAYLFLPESQARRIRVRWLSDPGPDGARLDEVRLMSVSFGDSPESLFTALAADAPRGRYPRGYVNEQRYWTVVGVEGDAEKVLFGEDGAIETGTSSFSIEPFLFSEGRLMTWADAHASQALAPGPLPIPSVRWNVDSLTLTITATATGDSGHSSVHVRYRLRSDGARARRVTLDLALRPFQVNPPTQFLNHAGGVAPIHSLAFAAGVVRGDGDRGVVSITPPSGFGAATFDQGDITDFLALGTLPSSMAVIDSSGWASGTLTYALTLTRGEEKSVEIDIPLHGLPVGAEAATGNGAPRAAAENRASRAAAESAAIARWQSRLSGASIEVPDSDVCASIQAQLAWILVNLSGSSLRPGARAYARTWIRDGALTSAALLRMGRADVVRDFIEWFAPFIYANGKVPCCVDERGSDPVSEYDSDGEFIYLVAEYARLTGDTALARHVWPQVWGAARHLDTLRAERRTPEWRTPSHAPFFGLLPPSISHEGYSAKPEHSYWDDLFALRGYRDAAELAGVLGDRAAQAHLRSAADEFAHDLGASVRAAMAAHAIDFIPGCADLGDFDATSTTLALDPVQAEELLPAGALERTFERYASFFRDRQSGRQPWDAYTPYEMRAIGAFVRLGWRERADSLLTFFLSAQRPSGWRQWPEVVWHAERSPRFLGDLPHTWVGSDFIRSVLAMLEYERESDQALVIAAGVPARWARDPAGVGVRGIRTRWGPLTYHLGPAGDGYQVWIESGLQLPAGGVRIAAPGIDAGWSAKINGAPVRISPEGQVTVRSLPATVELAPPR